MAANFALVPIYDGRSSHIDFDIAYPHRFLPRWEGELEEGDVVWIAFHSDMERTEAVFPSFRAFLNVSWVILLSRTGEEGSDALSEDVAEDKWRHVFF